MNNLKKYKIILASNSPRRRELLSGIDIDYIVQTLPDVDESYPEGLDEADVVKYIARAKAHAYDTQIEDNTLLITADTIVCLDGKIYGKPTSLQDAKDMLKALSGKVHKVLTGVCILTKDKEVVFSAESDVHFADLEEAEIEYYVEKYKPLDKAGAYGVQEWIGYIAVKHIEGSYFNIMGLPIQRLYTELKKF